MPNTAAETLFRRIAVGVIRRDSRILISQRPPGTRQAGAWEFPGGKVEAQETVYAALRRELAEELAIEVLDARPWLCFRHRYPQHGVELHVWQVLHFSGTPRGREGQALRWAFADQLETVNFLEGNRPIMTGLRRQAGLSRP